MSRLIQITAAASVVVALVFSACQLAQLHTREASAQKGRR